MKVDSTFIDSALGAIVLGAFSEFKNMHRLWRSRTRSAQDAPKQVKNGAFGMEEVADFPAWGRAAVERVSIREAARVPEFVLAHDVYTVWSRLGRDGLPAKRDLDPLGFGARRLPHMALIDVLETRGDYRWRLCGERVSAMLGTRLTGKRLSELEAQLGEGVHFRGLLDQVVRYRSPRFYVMRHTTVAGAPKRTYGVLLPLRQAPSPAEAPASVATILTASDWCSGV